MLPRRLAEADVGRLVHGFRYMFDKARESATWLVVDTDGMEVLDHFNEATGRCKRKRECFENAKSSSLCALCANCG